MHKSFLLRVALLLAIVGGLAAAFVYRDQLTPGQVQAFVTGLGLWAPVAFMGLWLAAAVVFIPGTALTVAGGALFGPLLGPAYSLLGAVTGATAAYGLGRFLGRDWVERNADGRLGRLKSGVEAEGWRFVAFVRLVPVAPFNLLNLGLGLTRIPLRTYVLTTLLCMLPGTVGYSYLGFAGREALLGGRAWMQTGAAALAVLAVLVFLPLLVRRFGAMRRAERAANDRADGESAVAGKTSWEPGDPEPAPEARA